VVTHGAALSVPVIVVAGPSPVSALECAWGSNSPPMLGRGSRRCRQRRLVLHPYAWAWGRLRSCSCAWFFRGGHFCKKCTSVTAFSHFSTCPLAPCSFSASALGHDPRGSMAQGQRSSSQIFHAYASRFVSGQGPRFCARRAEGHSPLGHKHIFVYIAPYSRPRFRHSVASVCC
jgi:hypothetical protein